MASFVSVKEYNKLKAKVAELEARLQALEGHGEAVYEAAQLEPAPEPEIPTIDVAVEEPSLFGVLDDDIVHKLMRMDYGTVEKVNAASDEDLLKITGIGAATVKKIRKALE